MNGKITILLSGLVAILMVTCAVPFMASEDSDALTQDSNMALSADRLISLGQSLRLRLTQSPLPTSGEVIHK